MMMNECACVGGTAGEANPRLSQGAALLMA